MWRCCSGSAAASRALTRQHQGWGRRQRASALEANELLGSGPFSKPSSELLLCYCAVPCLPTATILLFAGRRRRKQLWNTLKLTGPADTCLPQVALLANKPGRTSGGDQRLCCPPARRPAARAALPSLPLADQQARRAVHPLHSARSQCWRRPWPLRRGAVRGPTYEAGPSPHQRPAGGLERLISFHLP